MKIPTDDDFSFAPGGRNPASGGDPAGLAPSLLVADDYRPSQEDLDMMRWDDDGGPRGRPQT